ncbi:hypothetical protein Vretimale_10462 [Volvox reticuliferus]|uniref:Patatin n=1 Tax=Volvox reticuliferus TaxID=1737510 RepID=A0A8J4GFF0_9CHLO|nr:hypothetical protein Vretifemale_12536 [Volvox reticuliferus]GIM06184.1 hypothetical protein Vretimale_10462 [Volvox reticuliferus]
MPAPLQAPNSVAGRTLRGQPKVLCIQHPRNYTWHPAFDLIVARASPTHTGTRRAGSSVDACDLVLSSGFLAFAGHAGFLQAVEELGLPVGGVMGTSAGALAGSLFCAGYTPRQVAKHLSDQTPASLLRPSLAPWRGGALSLDQVINRLKDLLPPTFEDLHREFAVGVVTSDGQHLLIDSGPLPEAVAASAAIPFVFQAVDVPGHVSRHGPFKDGGVVDRVGLKAWRDRRRAQIKSGKGPSSVARPPPPCLVHVIDRSSPFSGFDDTNAMGESSIMVIKSPRSGANFFDLGSFEEHMDAARNRARPLLAAFARRNYNGSRHSSSGGSGGGPGSSNGLIVEEATSVATASSEAVVRARII